MPTSNKRPLPAIEIPSQGNKTIYPMPYAKQVEGRDKRKLGDFFGLTNFGINLTTLAPGSVTALMHHHTHQDEFIYILEGLPTLVYGNYEYTLHPGDCMGFPAGSGIASQVSNNTRDPVVLLAWIIHE